MLKITFITWDESTEGIAVEHDGREVWSDTARDSWDQYFRHYMPTGTPVLLSQDTRPTEREGQAADDPRPYPSGEGTDARLARWLVDNKVNPDIREEDAPQVTESGAELHWLLSQVAERFYWHGVDDVRRNPGMSS